MVRLSRVRLGLIALCLVAAIGCGGAPQELDPQLSQAVASVKYMTSKRWLSRSAFSATYPDAKPSDFVDYVFSDFGIAEWPIALDEGEREQLRSAGIPPLPPDIPLVPQAPDPTKTRQVVLRANDAEGTVIIEVYEDAFSPPIATISRSLTP